jgi:hypothetical protein
VALSSTIRAVQTSIETLVTAVAGIGNVYGYVPLIKTEAELVAKMAKDGVFNAVFITLAPQNPFVARRLPANQELADIAFAVHVYQRVEGDASASEQTFIDLVEDVIDAFRADKTLKSGGARTVIEGGPAQWAQFGHAEYQGVTCHFARLAYTVRTQVEP